MLKKNNNKIWKINKIVNKAPIEYESFSCGFLYTFPPQFMRSKAQPHSFNVGVTVDCWHNSFTSKQLKQKIDLSLAGHPRQSSSKTKAHRTHLAGVVPINIIFVCLLGGKLTKLIWLIHAYWETNQGFCSMKSAKQVFVEGSCAVYWKTLPHSSASVSSTNWKKYLL